MKYVIALALLWPLTVNAWCVSSGKANLRAGPGMKHPVTWSVPKFTPLVEVGRKGNWIEVKDQDGAKHWVYGSSVTKQYSCAAVSAATAKLRTGPSSSAALGKIQQVDKYTPFKRLDVAENGWYKVQMAWGEIYWIHPDMVWRPVRVTGVKL